MTRAIATPPISQEGASCRAATPTHRTWRVKFRARLPDERLDAVSVAPPSDTACARVRVRAGGRIGVTYDEP